jgi:hypothetical protein
MLSSACNIALLQLIWCYLMKSSRTGKMTTATHTLRVFDVHLSGYEMI